MGRKNNTWTEDRVVLLKKLWMEGLSASEIAKELGNNISRNAVIGKVHRLGLPARAPARRGNSTARTAGQMPKAGTQRQKAAARAATAPAARSNVVPKEEIEEMLQAATNTLTANAQETTVTEITRGRISDIMELNRHTCRWPFGDPGEEDFTYCGARVSEGLPYCEHHASIAYQDRRR
ncbi:GcrA family cell cycle regulator [Thermopetrobacter sp. TC1]|uniref:GcrA family cell cycle regulator n=1 Tax=Thermopetrobacter sp. TC1 TaxID=1495045 RepID=UPI0005700DB6|nr:GcrA family cell cycle regulator [Thermopetrobacter sp. TC1]